jgi:hypothetical protein
MTQRCLRFLVLASLTAVPAAAFAQPAPLQERWPTQEQEMKQSTPPASPNRRSQRHEGGEAAPPNKTRRPPGEAAPAADARAPSQPGRTLACSGVFARKSGHMALAAAFDSRNVAFTEVDGPEGSKLMASVLFPKDPKRRLEVLWQDEASRTDTALIVINGQSTWSGPKGLRLGLPLAALEKLNGKPFKLAGFDQDNGGQVLDWQDGGLTKLPGGCTVGVRLAPDPKAPEGARREAAGKELLSSDAGVRALRLNVSEVIFGYPQ